MSVGLDCSLGEPLGVLQSEPPAIYPFSFPFPDFFLFLSPYYNTQMWLHGPVVLHLCSLQLPVFETFYDYLGMTVLEIYLLGQFPPPVTLVQCWYAFVKHP
jgi:hypothetical protein